MVEPAIRRDGQARILRTLPEAATGWPHSRRCDSCLGCNESSAAAVLIAMVGGYEIAIARSLLAGGSMGAALALVYGLLYVLTISEDQALLTGSIGLVVVLGVGMCLPRRIDWYNLQTLAAATTQSTS